MLSESTTIDRDIALDHSPPAVRDEEPINALTHGVGGLLAGCATIWMVIAYAGAPRANLLASLVFTVLLTLTYAVSSISHAVSDPRKKYLWRAWDQGVIYLLIVGTYTPFWSKFGPAPVMAPTLALVWCAALVGFVSKVVYHWRVDESFSAVSYVALGWLPALTMGYCVPWECLQWIALGGVLYTAGVPFLTFDKRVPYFHTVWHFAVITASACHFYAVCRFVLA